MTVTIISGGIQKILMPGRTPAVQGSARQSRTQRPAQTTEASAMNEVRTQLARKAVNSLVFS